jgi:hypothetical protein
VWDIIASAGAGIVLGALTVAGVVIVAVVTAGVYALLLPASYLLAMAVMLTAELSAPLRSEKPEMTARPNLLDREVPLEESGTEAPVDIQAVQVNIWSGKHADEDIALPSYYFGPAASDFVCTVKAFMPRFVGNIRTGIGIASNALQDDYKLVGIARSVGIIFGMMVGGLFGLIVTAALGLLHVLVIAFTCLVALCACAVLRAVDWIRRLVGRIWMTCPECGEVVFPYPTYKCPRCNELHRDIRPGSRGIARRICKCHGRLPTSLLIGAGRLSAMCPKCGVALPSRFGLVPDIVVPLFGGVNVGKTRLMYTLVIALKELVTCNGGSVEFISDAKDRLDVIAQALARSGNTGPTLPESPRAYSLLIKMGLYERLIYLFDAAGELHYRKDGLDELKYLDKARIFIFVADPLASDSLWAKLLPEQRADMAAVRSDASEIELCYYQTSEQMRRLGKKNSLASLAFVVSKSDLVAECGLPLSESSDSTSEWVQNEDGLNLGNLVRSARQSFKMVKFFRTAAVTDDAGSADRSVEELALWLMSVEGIRLGG